MQEREAIIFGDTYAQWAMTFFNLIALGLSGWAIWLLKETLAATRVAVREAEKATAAALRGEEAAVGGVAEARHANDIARTANALSQRPWLSLVGPEPLGIRIMSTELGSPTKSVFFDFDVSSPTLARYRLSTSRCTPSQGTAPLPNGRSQRGG